jgi:two-component system NtrC family sensor kinase
MIDMADRYRFYKPDSSRILGEKVLEEARRMKFVKGESNALLTLGEYHRISGNYPEALQNLLKALELGRENGDSSVIGGAQTFIGISYISLAEYRTALNYLFAALEVNRRHPFKSITAFTLSNIGVAYLQLKMTDSAYNYQLQAWAIGKDIPLPAGIVFILRELGNVHNAMNNHDSAFYYYQMALSRIKGEILNAGRVYNSMALLHKELGNDDSALYYARVAMQGGIRSSQKIIILEASDLLTRYFIEHNLPDSALKYQQVSIALKDSLFGSTQLRKLQLMAVEEQRKLYEAEQRQQLVASEQQEYRNRVKLLGLLLALAAVLIIGIILFRNNRRKQAANELLANQKKEIEQTLTELRATQAQLVQSEKMASLGELTAGIAHEIQNPLNFVNNFSEVNTELLQEMDEELVRNNYNEARAIAKNVRENEAKILQHGKRADAIVKSMLQHSRSSSGVKEPSDLNALIDEYIRLSYHGLRAKDKNFTATIKTEFDNDLGLVNIIPQDMGRVVLNLINNAFYAVNDKRKRTTESYEPTVTVKTKQSGNNVYIYVRDNGDGIPRHLLDKIFQPFFTTKPAGQGTGLGLSLSYDIIKAHGGQIKIDSEENAGTEFILELPNNINSTKA